ncbi:zinc finger BED domain-containing protein RICESLEEPER 2-like [Camellia sinensis]|uniref:zinc finger BED domain-containing protein RICESLEEPER 2-like n=1 Tax=Camellia sinensis TaxID=4442 RepID=UPI001035BED0|nr:zinc finger BED domain-containing protein RICESLEEPER 2-like [Camellia sinensis]
MATPFFIEVARRYLANMIVIDELPFRFVEGVGFKRFCNAVQPKFKMPSRYTIARDIVDIYTNEKKRQFSSSGSTSELDKYLGDIEKGGKNAQFDILEWWKVNATKYRVLSLIAQDVLAMPVSTIACEFAFSTGGHILDRFRSSLTPKMVEVLYHSTAGFSD